MNTKGFKSFYIVLFILLGICSCNNSRSKQKEIISTESSSDSSFLIKTVDNTVKEEAMPSTAIKQDTIIGNYFISYLIKDNDNIISRQGITSKGDTILLKYPDRSVILNLKRKDNGDAILSNKEINKYIFKSLIPKEDDINQYQLWFFEIKNVDVDKVTFDLNICIPDTDICYFFNLCVSDDGNITITEIELNEEKE